MLPSVKAKGFLPRDAVPETMRKYAAVLLPLSLGCAHRNLVELSIATKMSESVAGGTITIVFGLNTQRWCVSFNRRAQHV
jgi:hypothetical protein